MLKDFNEIWKLLKGDKAQKVTYNNDNSITIVVNGNGNTFHADAFKIYPYNPILSTTMVARSLPAFRKGQFIQRIQEGEKFGNGDSLVVDLENF